MEVSSDSIVTIIWGGLGIAGILVLLLTSSPHRTVYRKGWMLRAVAIFFVGISIYGLSTINSGFASGLALLATLLVAFMALQSYQQTANLEARRANEAMLKEIMEWAFLYFRRGMGILVSL